MKKLIFITGASGTGKTTAIELLGKKNLKNIVIVNFDSIGVPSTEVMVKDFGGPEEWQKQKSAEWVRKIKNEYLENNTVILDGSIRQSFLAQACIDEGITNYEIILFDCSDEERNKRLIERGHPELVSEDMNNWAKYLRNEAIKRGDEIIDTTGFAIGQATEALLSRLYLMNGFQD